MKTGKQHNRYSYLSFFFFNPCITRKKNTHPIQRNTQPILSLRRDAFMYRQQQATQLANQLSHVQSIARQLEQAEARRQQIEQQQIAEAAQCRQLAQQVEQAVSQCIQVSNQIAQAPIQQAFNPAFATTQPQPNWQTQAPNPHIPLA
jgi:phosphoglycerate-specific signal transduction histidine kinase